MSIVVDLAPDEEARLRAHAARQGQDAAAYAAAVLRRQIDAVPAPLEEQTLAESLAGRVGRLRSPEPSDMAANSEAEFGRIMDDAVPAPNGETLADFLEGYIGVVDSRELNGGKPSHAAQNSEAEFGRIMDEKRRQGHV